MKRPMRRFFSPAKQIASDSIVILDSKHKHYIKNVLRLKPKAELIIFDELKNEYLAMIEEISKDKIIFKVKKKIGSVSASNLKFSIACAIPKKSSMDDIVDKLTQLGIYRIIPLQTERVIVKITGQKENMRIERWRRVALSACMQSQRKEVPFIDSIKSVGELLADSADYDLKLIPTLEGQRKPLKEVFRQSANKNILVLIGPEGDFSNREIELAKKHGCIPVSLGSLVLRVETAAVAVASFIRLYAES